MVEEVFKSFKSRYVHLSYEEHDLVTANTQAVTHAAFLRSVEITPIPMRYLDDVSGILVMETKADHQYGDGMA